MTELSAPLEDWQVSDLLSNLVDKSLVVFEADADGGGRYRLLETVRQYGDDKLGGAGERESLRVRHLDYFLRWAEDAHGKLGGPEQNLWFARTETERDNLRLALEISLAAPDGAQESLRLARAMQHTLHIHGRIAEAQAGLIAALNRPGASEPTKARGLALNEAGYVAHRRGDSALARACFEESVGIFRALGDDEGVAAALMNLGVQAKVAGNIAEARRLQEEAAAMSRAAGVAWLEAIALTNLAEIFWAENAWEDARVLLEKTVEIWRAHGDALNKSYALMKLGYLRREMGAIDESLACFAQTLRPLHGAGDRGSLVHALEATASLEIVLSRPERAVPRLLAARMLRASLEWPETDALETLRGTLGDDRMASLETVSRARTLTQLIDDSCRDV